MAVLLVCFSHGILEMQAAGGVPSKEILRREQHGRPTCLLFFQIMLEMQAAGGVQSKQIRRREQHGRPTSLVFQNNS